jgi:threonine aldolase
MPCGLERNQKQCKPDKPRGWRFYKFIEPDVYRLMCSWATTESDIGDFIRDVTLNH